jgi:hypothetical protein
MRVPVDRAHAGFQWFVPDFEFDVAKKFVVDPHGLIQEGSLTFPQPREHPFRRRGEGDQQEQATTSAAESLQLFTNRYLGGVDNYLQVITAQNVL